MAVERTDDREPRFPLISQAFNCVAGVVGLGPTATPRCRSIPAWHDTKGGWAGARIRPAVRKGPHSVVTAV